MCASHLLIVVSYIQRQSCGIWEDVVTRCVNNYVTTCTHRYHILVWIVEDWQASISFICIFSHENQTGIQEKTSNKLDKRSLPTTGIPHISILISLLVTLMLFNNPDFWAIPAFEIATLVKGGVGNGTD